MHFNAAIAASILAFTAGASATLTQSMSTPSATPSPTFAMPHGGALDMGRARAAAAAAQTTQGPLVPRAGGKPLTFIFENKSPGISVSISYQLNTYIAAGKTSIAPALQGPTATTGEFAVATTIVAPFGWAGRMTIGKAGAPLDYRGTKVEGNTGFCPSGNCDTDPDFDVSYVDGFSLPATCRCADNVVVTGCNKPLFHLGNTCANLVGDSVHPICVNDPRNIHGPPTPFFLPCNASAYTYDYNDAGSNFQGKCAGNTVTCCIGTNCPAPKWQRVANTKREAMGIIAALSQ